MTFDELLASVANDATPPAGLSAPLRALWFAKKGQWDQAHDVVNDLPSTMGSWIHAHLHRIEGDLGNAGYWYARAGRRALPHADRLEDEWTELVRANT